MERPFEADRRRHVIRGGPRVQPAQEPEPCCANEAGKRRPAEDLCSRSRASSARFSSGDSPANFAVPELSLIHPPLPAGCRNRSWKLVSDRWSSC